MHEHGGSSYLGSLSVATVSGGHFISLECLIVASQGPFLAATSTRRLAKGRKTIMTFFSFFVHIIITPLIGVLKIAPYIVTQCLLPFYLYMYTRGSSFFLGKVTALGVMCCFALFVCLILLASFFLPSHLSFKNMYMYILGLVVGVIGGFITPAFSFILS